jgi:hypothetical protein
LPSVALRAHYDGTQILLDEEFALPVNAQLIVTVLPDPFPDRSAWSAVAAQGLALAFGEDEPEYSCRHHRNHRF